MNRPAPVVLRIEKKSAGGFPRQNLKFSDDPAAQPGRVAIRRGTAVEDKEDEVLRRARLATEARAEIAAAVEVQKQTKLRNAERAEGAVDVLLDDVQAATHSKTSARVRRSDSSIFCDVSAGYQSKAVELFRVDLYPPGPELSSEDYEPYFNCTRFAFLDPHNDDEHSEIECVDHKEAFEFGVDAVLSGLGVQVSEGWSIINPRLAPEPEPTQPAPSDPGRSPNFTWVWVALAVLLIGGALLFFRT